MVGKLEKHLKVYYTFYFEEMINAFKVNDDPLKNAPPNAWRWRCDPKELKEDDNYARFYDFDTVRMQFCFASLHVMKTFLNVT